MTVRGGGDFAENQRSGAARFWRMKRRTLYLCAFFFCLAVFRLPAVTPTLQQAASFPTQQVTGVAVSKSGRIFVNFPDWSDGHTISVAEMVNGQPEPFPNEDWNRPGPVGDHF